MCIHLQVRQQIQEKEAHRVQERNAFFEEGVRLDEEARARRAKLEDIKRKKLEELRYGFFHCLIIFSFQTSQIETVVRCSDRFKGNFRPRAIRLNFIDHSVREIGNICQKALRVSFCLSNRDMMCMSFRRPSFFFNTKGKMTGQFLH